MSRPKIKRGILAKLARKKSYTFLLCVLLQCSADSLSAHGNLHKEIEALSLKIQATPKNVALWLERLSCLDSTQILMEPFAISLTPAPSIHVPPSTIFFLAESTLEPVFIRAQSCI